jgi:hypothetical protein
VAVAVAVMLAVAATLAGATAALALTEARIVQVTCAGLTVVQTGLPPNAPFDVTAINGANGRVLTERRVHSTSTGRLLVRLHTDLHGVRRLHSEVERAHVRNSEYGEADVDLNRHCAVVGTKPVPVRTSSSSASAAPSTRPTPIAFDGPDANGGTPWEVTAAVAVAVAAVVGAAVWWIRRRAITGS